jgi:hypothetical protein
MDDVTRSCEIPDSVLSLNVQGANLRGATFGQNVDGPPTLVVFLRHFG